MATTRAMARLAMASLVLTTLAACGGSGRMSGTQYGTLRLQLTDAPFLGDSVQSVNVFVVRVDGRLAAVDSAGADSSTTGDSASAGGWTTLAMPNDTVNLISYQNGNTLPLGDATLPVGSYDGFRLVIDPSQSNVVLKDGLVLTGSSSPGIKFPSGDRSGLKVNLTSPVTIAANDTTTMLIDFRVDSSFVMRGNAIVPNGLLFKPVIQASIQ
jgi:Domain of unknown function (DUF4382)